MSYLIFNLILTRWRKRYGAYSRSPGRGQEFDKAN
jgi:hypothetical protein